VEAVKEDRSKGVVKLRVASAWQGRTTTKHVVEGYELGGETIERRHEFESDEPVELLGTDAHPNPQEYLLAALNSCMTVGYVAGASVRGIRLDKVEIESSGSLDLAGFLGIDETINPGYDEVSYTVRIHGDGTPEQFREIHETVLRTSPNVMNFSRPIRLNGELVTG
jgi:uncharacterized OsmC-like protein